LGFGELIAQHLTDSRQGKNTQLPLANLLRQSVYSRLAESHLTKRLFGAMVGRIAALPVATGLDGGGCSSETGLNWRLAEPKDGSPQKKCTSEDRKLAAGCIINGS
jgi:hypothetical protein